MTSDLVLSPQTPRGGVTAGEHRHLQQAGPLPTEASPAKHLERKLGSLLKQLTRGLLPLYNTQESFMIPRSLTPGGTDDYGSMALSL